MLSSLWIRQRKKREYDEPCHRKMARFLYQENHALDAWYKKAYGDEQKAKADNDRLSASGGQYFFYVKKVLDEKDTWGESVVQIL